MNADCETKIFFPKRWKSEPFENTRQTRIQTKIEAKREYECVKKKNTFQPFAGRGVEPNAEIDFDFISQTDRQLRMSLNVFFWEPFQV